MPRDFYSVLYIYLGVNQQVRQFIKINSVSTYLGSESGLRVSSKIDIAVGWAYVDSPMGLIKNYSKYFLW
jgi:hypothetical protein